MATKRVSVTFRVAPEAREKIRTMADEHEVDFSTVMRAMLRVASQHRREVEAILSREPI